MDAGGSYLQWCTPDLVRIQAMREMGGLLPAVLIGIAAAMVFVGALCRVFV